MKFLVPQGFASLAVAEGATTPAPGYPAEAWSTTLGCPVYWNGSKWSAMPPQVGAASGQALVWNGTTWAPATVAVAQTVAMTATQAFSTTTLASVTSLVLPVAASSVYTIDCEVTFQSAATGTGLNLGLTTPSGSSNRVEIVVPITSTAAASQLRTIFPNAAVATNGGNVAGTGVTAANSSHTARISGTIVTGTTAGNLQIVAASSSTTAVTLQIGSRLTLLKVG